MVRIVKLFCAFFMTVPLAVWAANASLPPWSGLAPTLVVQGISADERYGEARMPTMQDPQQIVRGRHWEASLKATATEAAPKAIWERLKPALVQSGWTVVDDRPRNPLSATLHLTQGRDLWAVLRHAPGEAMLQVGDAGLSDLAQALQHDCRVTLLGVLFDFDQATLKPESDAVLARARAAIASKPTLALEVQGHTDAVGNDAYNQKPPQVKPGVYGTPVAGVGGVMST